MLSIFTSVVVQSSIIEKFPRSVVQRIIKETSGAVFLYRLFGDPKEDSPKTREVFIPPDISR